MLDFEVVVVVTSAGRSAAHGIGDITDDRCGIRARCLNGEEGEAGDDKENNMNATFRGIFLTSRDPRSTAEFYRQVAGLPLETVGEGDYIYWRLDRDGVQLAIHDAGAFSQYAHPPNPGSNLTHLYFKIDDRDAFLSRLDAMDLEPVDTDDVVVTVADPDGRKVMFGTA